MARILTRMEESAQVADDFGSEGGTEITNKWTILQEVDEALGCKKPPALEYILVLPFAIAPLAFGFGIGINNYGHSCVRYTLPGGKQMMMNVVGKNINTKMIDHSHPADYLYGTKFHDGDQAGVYNRAMISVRVEELPDELIEQLHEYYLNVQNMEESKQAKFHLVFGPVLNFLRDHFPFGSAIAERGNCARWTSMGLKEIGVITKQSMWPKSVWINIFENAEKTNVKSHDNVHVVSYRHVTHARQKYGLPLKTPTGVAPFQPIRNLWYWNLERFADAIVEVPKGSMTAEVRTIPNPDQPSKLRNATNGTSMIVVTAVATMMAVSRYNSRIMQRFQRRKWT